MTSVSSFAHRTIRLTVDLERKRERGLEKVSTMSNTKANQSLAPCAPWNSRAYLCKTRCKMWITLYRHGEKSKDIGRNQRNQGMYCGLPQMQNTEHSTYHKVMTAHESCPRRTVSLCTVHSAPAPTTVTPAHLATEGVDKSRHRDPNEEFPVRRSGIGVTS